MKKIISVLMAVLMLTTCIPVIGFAAGEITVALADETAGTAIDWTQPNTIDVVFTGGEVDPESVTAENISLVEDGGSVSDVALIVEEATSTTAKIKLGKLRAMQKYSLTFKNIIPANNGETFANQSIDLKSNVSDMFGWQEHSSSGRGNNNPSFGHVIETPILNYDGTLKQLNDGKWYRQNNQISDNFVTQLYPKTNGVEIGDLTYEFWGSMDQGELDLGGYCDDSHYGLTITPSAVSVKLNPINNAYTYTSGEWAHLRINYFKGVDGKYNRNIWAETDNGWVKIGEDVDLGITSFTSHGSSHCSRSWYKIARMRGNPATVNTHKLGMYTI